MREYGRGDLKSSSGKKVTSRDQALAIAYSESGEGKMKDKKMMYGGKTKKMAKGGKSGYRSSCDGKAMKGKTKGKSV